MNGTSCALCIKVVCAGCVGGGLPATVITLNVGTSITVASDCWIARCIVVSVVCVGAIVLAVGAIVLAVGAIVLAVGAIVVL